MNKQEDYSLRYILNDFVKVKYIKKDNNNYLISLNEVKLTLDIINKINKNLNINYYELKEIISTMSGLIDLVVIKNIHIKDKNKSKSKEKTLFNLNFNKRENKLNKSFPFSKNW